jgi:NTP pyrophosphatase (non-canonical NTP hydrolase)
MTEILPNGQKERAREIFQRMEDEVFRLNNSKGWFDEDRSVGDMVALLHSEVSEILEAYRSWKFQDATTGQVRLAGDGSMTAVTGPKPEGVGAEMADCLIRLLDMAKRWEIDLVAEYYRKMNYNWTRPYRHGGRHL